MQRQRQIQLYLHSPLRNILIASAVVLSVLACGGGSSSNGPQEQTQSKTIQQILDDGIQQGLDGIYVYIDKGDESPISIAAGIKDRSTQQPATPETLFKIASISKMFIAVATVKAVHQSSLQLDDTLAQWLPDLADRIEHANLITVRHLLQHRSGVPDFDSQPGFSWQNSYTDIDSTLSLALDKPADFFPDAIYAYSNTNYLLLGKILDTALGYSHHVFIQDNILTPLDMQDTYSLLAEINIDLLSKGYWDNVERSQQDYVIPGGSMISTVRDIATFLRALSGNEYLSTEEKQTYNNLFGGYGHSGWLPGYQSIARYESQYDAVIVQFVNKTGGGSENVANGVYSELVAWVSN